MLAVALAAMGSGAASFALSAETEAPLLAASRGALPNDTGGDGQTTFATVESQELGGRSLRVNFAPGDSVGVKPPRVADWTPFTTLRLTAFNPTSTEALLVLTVKHGRTSGFPSRVDIPLKLKPGKNTLNVPIARIVNNDGSAPDLAHVAHWYLANAADRPLTVFLGDVVLAGAIAPATIQSPSGNSFRSDPARLARIRAARMPAIDKPVLFNTPEADALCGALEVFPPDNPWNAVIEDWPLHPNSDQIVASIGVDKPFRYNPDMAFILVPPDQERVTIANVEYPDESDPGPYPLPAETPIEGWPAHYRRSEDLRNLSLDDVQRDRSNLGGDRHALIVDPTRRVLYEFYQLRKTDRGWQAAQASIFDLKSNRLRPEGWTSADAAGLPIFPAVVRYDELKRGMVEHAMRVTVRRTRRAYVAPATHYASRLTDPHLPRMGERLRLKQDFDLRGFSPEVQAILKGLKKYGMMVADNGIDWAISVAPDERIPVLHEELRRIKGSAFEVVVAPGSP